MTTIHGKATSRGCLGGGVFRRWCTIHYRDTVLRTKAKNPREATARLLMWLSPTAKGPLDW